MSVGTTLSFYGSPGGSYRRTDAARAGGGVRVNNRLMSGNMRITRFKPGDPSFYPRNQYPGAKLDGEVLEPAADQYGRQYVIAQTQLETQYPDISVLTGGSNLYSHGLLATTPAVCTCFFGYSYHPATSFLQLYDVTGAEDWPGGEGASGFIKYVIPIPAYGTFSVEAPLLFEFGAGFKVSETRNGDELEGTTILFTAVMRYAYDDRSVLDV